MRNPLKQRNMATVAPVVAATVMTLLILSQDASAQLGRPQFRSMPKLTETDLTMARKLVREDLATRPTGTTLSWSNPESSNSGTVTLVARFVSRGRDCLRVRYNISPGVKATADEKPNSYILNNCRSADGSWHLDSGARPDKPHP
jgi:surface antigen